MMKTESPILLKYSLKYFIAVALVVLAQLVTLALWSYIQPYSFPLFFAAVTVSAWYGGLGPGLVSTALATTFIFYFFPPPDHTQPFGIDDIIRLGTFVLVAMLISSLSAQLQSASYRARANALQARKHHKALQRVEERYYLLMENVRDYAMFMLDTDGRIVSWNVGAESILGYHESEIVGELGKCIFTPEDIQLGKPEQELRTAAREGRAVNERWHVKKDGTWFWGSGITTALRDETGKLRGFAKLMRDLSEQKHAEDERSHLLEERSRLLEEAEAANRMKDEFLAVLSHELRSPLNPILGWSKLLLQRKFDEQTYTRALNIIDRNAKLQAQLVEDLLDISQILHGKFNLNVLAVDITFVITAAIDTVRLSAEAKSIQIMTAIEAPDAQVLGDPNRLQQVVWNLLSNAVKFTPPGGQINVRTVEIEDEGTLNAATLKQSAARHLTLTNYVQITVADTGKGIHPDFLPCVFDYFRQADSSNSRRFGGLGLGLAIVRHLVELHGGTVYVDSRGEGQGATFTVRLPLMASDLDQPALKHLPAQEQGALSKGTQLN